MPNGSDFGHFVRVVSFEIGMFFFVEFVMVVNVVADRLVGFKGGDWIREEGIRVFEGVVGIGGLYGEDISKLVHFGRV